MALPIPPVAPPALRTVAPNRIPDPTSTVADVESPGGGSGFADAVGQALNTVGQLEGAVTEAGRQAATGDLRSVSDYMIATSEAQLATEITVAIRDRAIAAFNDIMRMQI